MSVNVDQSFPEPKMTSSYDLFVHNPARLQCISILYCCNIKIFWYSIFLEHLWVQLLVGNKEQHEDISLSPRNIYIYNILTFYAFYKHWLIYWKNETWYQTNIFSLPWVLPILSGRSSLNETVEVPRPPDLVVTMISPLSSLAGPTRHTILLADIHSAVSRQLWPQIDRPEMEERRKRWKGWEIQTHSDSTNKWTAAPTHIQTIYNKRSSLRLNWRLLASLAELSPGVRVQVWVRPGSGWPCPSFLSLSSFKLTCVTWLLSGPLLAQCTLCLYICRPLFKPSWKLFGHLKTDTKITLTFPAEVIQQAPCVYNQTS